MSGYYNQPVLKPPVWTWEVPLYFFVGGTAGSAAALAAVYETVVDVPVLARSARGLAMVGALLSPALLISDLGRPERFLNMLRVFKPQSPMSMGSWLLASFGAFSGVSFVGHELFGNFRIARAVAQAAQVAAALTGSMVATYPGVLIGATVIPVWNRHSTLLPAYFGTLGMGAAVSLLQITGQEHRGLDALGVSVAAASTAMSLIMETPGGQVQKPLHEGTSGTMLKWSAVLCGPLNLGLRLCGWRRLAGLTFVAGALLSRYGWLEAGRASALDPQALFEQQGSAAAEESPSAAAEPPRHLSSLERRHW